nr:Nucleoporin nup84 [Polyrhizophydium stewartii]
MARRTKLLDLEGFEPQLVAESTTGEVFVLDDDTEEFAQILRDASPADVLEEDGLVSQYEQCCRNRALMYMENHQPEKARPWAQEANTWRLVRILFSHRHATETNMDTAAERVAASENIFKSDFVRADEIWADRELQEHLLVKEWMEMIAPDFQAVEIRKGHFPHTAMHIRGQKRIGASTAASALGIPSFADQIVSELDPDAMTRQHRRVVPEDQAYESELVRTIFEYVRRGRIADALDLCHACDQTWRAMSLSGGMLRVDSFVDGEATEDSGDVRGNENVVLWKATCYQLAMDEQADPYERATYALLSGDIKNVLPVCHSWEDHVWARYNAFIENQSLKVSRAVGAV